MKKVLIKVYVFPVTKSKIQKTAIQSKKSQSNIVRNWVEVFLDTLVFSEDEKGRVGNG